MERWTVKDYSVESYREFLRLKRAPIHRVEGSVIHFEDFAGSVNKTDIVLAEHLFDYQQFIVKLALAKRRYAVFGDVGLGKTAIFLEFIRHISKIVYPRKSLIISQINLINQTIEEQIKWYGWTNICDINARFGGDLQKFIDFKNSPVEGIPVGIINIDKFNKPFRLQGNIGAVVFDESSALANATGKQRTNIINSCKGIEYKMACTATPNRNNRMEYGSHCLWLDYIDNYKQFFSRYFYNTGSGNDFVLKPHAKGAFYKFLSTWSIFIKNPVKYGFNDNLSDLKPAEVIWDRVPLTEEQKTAALKYGTNGQLNMLGVNVGGICHRSKCSQISKGFVYQEG
jgi:hypothetical protein